MEGYELLKFIESEDFVYSDERGWLLKGQSISEQGTSLWIKRADADFIYMAKPEVALSKQNGMRTWNPEFKNFTDSHRRFSRLNVLLNWKSFLETENSLEEWGLDTYSWFIVWRRPQEALRLGLHSGGSETEVRQVATDDEKQILRKAWKRDYVETVLKDYSPAIKKSQFESIESQFAKANMRFYFYQNMVVGHGAWEKVEHFFLRRPCVYWHQWVSPDLTRELRRVVHAQFFNDLGSESIPAMSGVCIANDKSIKHCLNNDFRFPMLSIRFPETPKEAL